MRVRCRDDNNSTFYAIPKRNVFRGMTRIYSEQTICTVVVIAKKTSEGG